MEKGNVIGIPVIQNQQEFVLSKFTISEILKFTKYTKRLIVGYTDEGIPIYNNHIQREVESNRIEKIADFLINDPEATFPTNIVLHIPNQVILYQKEIIDQETDFRFLDIGLTDKVFEEVKKEKKASGTGDIFINIIDGQHRIRGVEVAISRLQLDLINIAKVLEKNTKNQDLINDQTRFHKRLNDLLNIELVVSFFIDKSLEYQAMIFSTINRTQKRVSESLVYSLFGLTTGDSPQKTALQVVLAMNSLEDSPFFNRIKLYGGSYDKDQSPPLSQATMVKAIIDRISENSRQAELDRYKSRRDLSHRTAGSEKNLIFRSYYVRNEDSKISDIFYYYFTSVKNTFKHGEKSYWDFNPSSSKPENILQTTAGFFSLLQILEDVDEEIKEKDKFTFEVYSNYLKKAKDLNFADQKRYPFTTKSRSILYLDMSLKIWPAKKDDKRLVRLQQLLEDDN